MPWELRCLICGAFDTADLVAIQEHAMAAHGVTRDQLRLSARRGPIVLERGRELFEWKLPGVGGCVWLRAICYGGKR